MPFPLTNRALVTLAALIGVSLAAIDVTIVGTAMPTIVGTLGGLALYSWVFAAYVLASTTSVPLYGKLADLYGRKPVFVVGATTFLIGSALCGMARSMEELILFRALQGLGAGAVLPVAQTVTGDIYPIEQRARIQGLFGSIWGIAGILGPGIGALVVEHLGWRWIFYINVPIGIMAILLMIACLQESQVRQGQYQLRDLDFSGAALLTFGILAFLGALLIAGQTQAWLSPKVIGLVVLAIGLLVAFWRVERQTTLPVMPPALLQRPLIGIGVAVGVLAGGVLIGTEAFLPLFMQGVLLGTATSAGAVLGAMSASWPIGSAIGGRLMLRFGYRIPAVLGGLALAIGSLVLAVATFSRPPIWVFLAAMSACGIGQGLINASLIISIQNSVGWAERGIATALFSFARSMGMTLGSSLLGTLFTALMLPRLVGAGIELRGGLRDPAGSASTLLDPVARNALPPDVLTALQVAVAESLNPVFFALVLISLGVIAVAWRLPRERPAAGLTPGRVPPGCATPSPFAMERGTGGEAGREISGFLVRRDRGCGASRAAWPVWSRPSSPDGPRPPPKPPAP